ncbi:hypothetical protein BKI52_27465 [marine bacterium AO1-C]|nr:hypothetical protein BKI52_27465 [marine bacterium AO1-C]
MTAISDIEASLYQHFEQYIRLSDALKEALKTNGRFTVFKKKELLHNADRICTESHFIYQGLVRTYFIKDGKEVCEYFSAENEWINSPRSFMQQQLDVYYIDAIEDTQVFSIKLQKSGYLFDHFPEMERYARLSMGDILWHCLDRINSMHFTTAKEKYNHFCHTHRQISHRIPLGMVASYLGIAQETLSRIRAEK